MSRCCLALSFAVLLAALPCSAQTTFASVTGMITDPTGASVAGAEVIATRAENNFRYATRSNQAGYYTLGQLLEGEYVVKVEVPGFKPFLARDVRLNANDVRRIDIALEVGSVSSSVEVSAGATLIETEKARISDTKSGEELKNLPMNSRSLWTFLGQSAGVLQASSSTATRRFAGSRVNQSDASLDGITMSTGRDGSQISTVVGSIEGFEEVRVDMANNTAEFGSIGQVTVVSKSGTNEFRGSVFDYYITSMFRARNPFAQERSSSTYHSPGGSIGGPVIIPRIYNGANRTFFYFNIENNRGSATRTLLTPTVPPTPWRSGDFSSLTTVVRDPMAGNAPFPSNKIPANRLNSVSTRIQDRFYPLPNYNDPNVLVSQNYREMKVTPRDTFTIFNVRGDHRLSNASLLFGRFTWTRGYYRPWEAGLPTIGQGYGTRDTRALNLSYSNTIRPSLLSETRFGYIWNDYPRHGPIMGKQYVEELGLKGLAPDLPDINGLTAVSFTGLGITGISQQVWRHPGSKNYVLQFQQHFTWMHGRHTVKGGAIIGRTNYVDASQDANLFGNVNFSNRFTGHPYADFLLGIPTTSSRAFTRPSVEELRWSYDFFVTDEFRIARALTLDLGLRYEIHPTMSNPANLMSLFDIGTGKIVIPDGMMSQVSPLMPKNYVGVVEAHELGLPSSTLLKTDMNNIAPRIGLAWRPLGNNTVFRGGFGIFYDVTPMTATIAWTPFVIREPSFTNPANNPTIVLPYVFPSSVAGPTTVSLPAAGRFDLRIPYSMQYNFTVEHSRWNTGFRLSYIGTNTRQGEWRYNINQPAPDKTAFVDKPRMYPNYPAINYLTNGAGHQYHSLTAEARRRVSSGLTYQVTYVLARDIGDLERGEGPENAMNRARERGVWVDIPTHRLTGNFLYELPFGKGRRWLSSSHRWWNYLFGGWDISGVYTYHSGQFLTPLWTGPDPTGTAYTSSRTPAQVSIRPDILRDANLPSSNRSVTQWFDVSAFAAPAAGAFGTSARGVLKGPPINVLDSGLFKTFRLAERLLLRGELTAVNVMNHPNWNNPSTNITSIAQVGRITGIGGVSDLDPSGARTFRLGVRLEW